MTVLAPAAASVGALAGGSSTLSTRVEHIGVTSRKRVDAGCRNKRLPTLTPDRVGLVRRSQHMPCGSLVEVSFGASLAVVVVVVG